MRSGKLHLRRRGIGSAIRRGLLDSTRICFVTLLSTATALAQPSGSSVVAGTATVSAPSSTLTTVNQTSAKAIINWQDFSVAAGSTVQFNQPGSASITLNRVVGGNASAVDGAVKANGQVWLLNPNGVLIGKDANINVGGLLATTSDIANQDFLDGNYNFSGGGNGAVTNDGKIRAGKGGSVVLSAPNAANHGLIAAKAGHVVIGGTDTFTVDFNGDHLLSYAVGAGHGGSATNSGKISAPGGQVLLTARAAAGVADGVVNNSGMVEATSAREENGEIILDAGDGTATNSGTLNASGRGAGETGGSVQILGQTVQVTDKARIDVSGDAGGGQVLIGGNFHGAGPQQNAQITTVGKASIKADAIHSGNGGKVAIWSSGVTQFDGSISAQGGATGGNGGQVETSGHNLGVGGDAIVSTAAPQGVTGNWLLDPSSIDIVSGSGNDDTGLPTVLYGDSPSAATIDASAIVTSLQGTLGTGTDVTLQANNDITVSSAISASSSKTLELDAGHSIILNANILVSNGSIILTANNPGGSSGNAGDASITSASGVTLTAVNVQLGLSNSVGSTGSIGTPGTPIAVSSGSGAPVELTVGTQGASAWISGAANVDIAGANLNQTSPSVPGNFTLTALGSITQSGAIQSTDLNVSATAPGSSIDLENGGNEVFGVLRFNTGTGGDATFANGGNPFQTILGVSDVGGDLSVTSPSNTMIVGDTAQLGSVVVTGSVTLNDTYSGPSPGGITDASTSTSFSIQPTNPTGISAAGLTVTTTKGSIQLDQALNTVTGTPVFHAPTGVAFANSGDTTLGTINDDGGPVAGDITVTSTGSVTLNGTLNSTTSVSVSAGNGIIEGVDVNSNPIGLIQAPTITLGGGTGSIGSANTMVQLDGGGGPVTLSVTSGAAAFLSSDIDVTLDGVNVGSGAFALISTGGGIFNQPGQTVTANTVSLEADSGTIGSVDTPITITSPGNLSLSLFTNGNDAFVTSANSVSVSIDSNGVINAGNPTGVALGSDCSVATCGNFNLTAAGSISQSWGITAADLNVTTTGNGNNITLTDPGNCCSPPVDDGNVISGTARFNSAGNVSFLNADQFDSVTKIGQSMVGGDLSVQATSESISLTDTGSGSVTVTGNTTLTSNVGTVDEEGLSLTTANLTVSAAGITLNNTGNAISGTIEITDGNDGGSSNQIVNGVSTTLGKTFIRDGSLSVTTVGTGSNLTLNDTNGSPSVDVGGDVTLNANGNITQSIPMSAASLTVTAADQVCATGCQSYGISLNSTTNNVTGLVTLYAAGDIVFNNATDTQLGQAQADNSGDPANSVSVTVTGGALTTTDQITATGAVSLTSDGDLTSSGGQIDADTVSLTSNSGNIGSTVGADQPLFLFLNTFTASTGGGDVVVNLQPLNLGVSSNITIGDGTKGINAGSGNVMISSDGGTLVSSVASAGVITAQTLNVSTSGIDLEAGNAVSGPVTLMSQGDIVYNSSVNTQIAVAAADSLGDAANSVTLSVTGGSLEQSGPIAGVNFVTLSADGITQDAGQTIVAPTITLGGGTGDIGSAGSLVQLDGGGGPVTLSVTSGTNAYLSSDIDVALAGENVGSGSFTLISTGGGITQSSGAIIANTISLDSTQTDIGTLAAPIAIDRSSPGDIALSVNSAGAIIVTSAQPVTIANNGVLAESGLTANGDIYLTTTSGSITVADQMVAPGLTVFLTAANGIVQSGSGQISATRVELDGGSGAIGSGTPLAMFQDGGTFLLFVNGGTSANLSVTGASDVEFDGVTLGSGALTLQSAGGITQSVPITTGALNLTASGGDLTLDDPNNSIGGVVTLNSSGDVLFNNTVSTIMSGRSAAGGSITVVAAGDLTLASGAQVIGGAAGDAVVLSAIGNYVNEAGSSGIGLTGGGRFLVFSNSPGADMFGGVDSGAYPVWDTTYPSTISQTGSRYVFALQPTITVSATPDSKTYGVDDTASIASDYTISGLQGGSANAYLADTAAQVYSGTPSITSAGSAANANVSSSPYAMTASAGSLTVGDGYAVAFQNSTLTLSAATLTYNANAAGRGYGAADPTYTGTVTGFVAGDSQGSATTGTLTFATTATSTSGVGNYAINGSGLTANNGNYVFVQAAPNATALTINPATLTYTADAASRAYGAADPTYTGTVTGFVNGENQGTATTGTMVFTTTATTGDGVGNYAINGSGLSANNGNYVFVQAAPNATALTINPATLTYTADAASRAYGAADPTYTGTVTGFVNGENQGTATTGTLSFSTSATTGSNVGNYAINGSGLTPDSNYVLVQAGSNATALTINPATLTYNANAAGRGYGAADPTYTGTVTGFVNGENQGTATTGTLTFATTATATSGVGNYAINGSGLTANNGNYVFVQAVPNATALTINPATLTYTADAASRAYGAADPTYTGTVTGFVNGENQGTATTGTLTFATTATATSGVGNYAINGSGLSANNGNYVFVQAAPNATALTINPATLAYTADSQSRSYGAANPALTGTVTGFVNGDNQGSATTGTLSFSTSATAGSNVGSYAINGSGLTPDSNYVLVQAGGNTAALTINPATLTYLANSASRAYGSANPALSGTVSGFVNGDTQGTATTGTLTFTTGAIAGSNAGSYAINGSGLSSNTSNYVFAQASTNATALTINPGTLVYTAGSASRTYGAANPVLSGTVTGFVNGDTQATATSGALTFVSSATAGSSVGTYAVNGSGLTASNYVFTQASTNASALAVNPATLTYTAGSASRTYGAANPALSGAVTGFVNGDTQASATAGALAFATSATASSSVGTYAVNGSGLTANNGNYVFVQASGNATDLVITRATLTESLTGSVSKTFDGTTAATLTSANYNPLSGIVGTDSVALASFPTTGTYDTAAIGSGKTVTVTGITLTGASAANYTIAGSVSGPIGVILEGTGADTTTPTLLGFAVNNTTPGQLPPPAPPPSPPPGSNNNLSGTPPSPPPPPPPPPPGPLADLTSPDGSSPPDTNPSDQTTDFIANSLNGGGSGPGGGTTIIITGLLTGGGAPPLTVSDSGSLSSWGNDSLWQ